MQHQQAMVCQHETIQYAMLFYWILKNSNNNNDRTKKNENYPILLSTIHIVEFANICQLLVVQSSSCVLFEFTWTGMMSIDTRSNAVFDCFLHWSTNFANSRLFANFDFNNASASANAKNRRFVWLDWLISKHSTKYLWYKYYTVSKNHSKQQKISFENQRENNSYHANK